MGLHLMQQLLPPLYLNIRLNLLHLHKVVLDLLLGVQRAHPNPEVLIGDVVLEAVVEMVHEAFDLVDDLSVLVLEPAVHDLVLEVLDELFVVVIALFDKFAGVGGRSVHRDFEHLLDDFISVGALGVHDGELLDGCGVELKQVLGDFFHPKLDQ